MQRVRVTKVVILSGQAESELFWGTVWKVVHEAGKGGMWTGWASPEKQETPCWAGRTWSESPVVQLPPSPTSPHPVVLKGGIPYTPKAVQAPPGCMFLANYLLFSWHFVDFVFFKPPNCNVSQLFDCNSAIDLCLLYPFVSPSQSHDWGTEAKAVKRFPEHRFFTVIHLMVSYVLALIMQFPGSPNPKACPPLCVDEGLGVGLMDSWSFLASTPLSSAGLPGPVLSSISALPHRSQERHFRLWEAALDFLLWPCRCFRNFS